MSQEQKIGITIIAVCSLILIYLTATHPVVMLLVFASYFKN